MSTQAMTITLIILLGLGIAGLLGASKYLLSIYLPTGKHRIKDIDWLELQEYMKGLKND